MASDLVPAWAPEELGNKGMERFVPQVDLPREARARVAPARYIPGEAAVVAPAAAAAAPAAAAPVVIDLTRIPEVVDLTAPPFYDESQEVIPVNQAASDDAIQRARFYAGIPGAIYYAPMWFHPRNVIPDKSFLEIDLDGKVLGWMEPVEDLDAVMDAPPMSAGELARRYRREEAVVEAADECRKRARRQ